MNARSSLVVLCAAIFSLGATTQPLPTADELHQMFSQGQYLDVLKGTRGILAQTDQSTVDRVDLLKLKGEALLRTHSDSEAADAYHEAAQAAKSEDDASGLRATSLLFHQCHQEIYTPKAHATTDASSQSTAPISVIGESSRKEAFAAMFDDEMTAKAHQIDAAKKATGLQPILEVAPSLRNLQDLEKAANGSTDKSDAAAKSVADHAKDMIDTAQKKLTAQLDEIEKKAGQTEHVNGNGTEHHYNRRRGLNSDEITQLRDIGTNCDQIVTACTDLGKALGSEGGEFSGLAKSAQDLKKRADEAAKKYGPKTA
jgi:hypothetical protein